MKIDSTLFRGIIDKDLKVILNYQFEEGGQFQTILKHTNGKIYINPSYALSITEGFGKPNIFIPGNRYYQFLSLLNNTIKAISENLYQLFPNIGKVEFDIDSRTLERFQTEKALSTAGMTMMPAVWVDTTSSSYPGIRISTNINNSSICIPFEDAIPINKMLDTFDPNAYSLSMLRILGKVD